MNMVTVPEKINKEIRELIYECYQAFEDGYATWPDDMWDALVAEQKGEKPPVWLRQYRLDQDCGNDYNE